MRNVQFASAFGLLLLLSSCTTHRDPRVKALTALADSIQTYQRLLEEPSDARTAEAATRAENNLREFELLLDDGNVVVSKEEGRIISDVSRARRLLKDRAADAHLYPKVQRVPWGSYGDWPRPSPAEPRRMRLVTPSTRRTSPAR